LPSVRYNALGKHKARGIFTVSVVHIVSKLDIKAIRYSYIDKRE